MTRLISGEILSPEEPIAPSRSRPPGRLLFFLPVRSLPDIFAPPIRRPTPIRGVPRTRWRDRRCPSPSCKLPSWVVPSARKSRSSWACFTRHSSSARIAPLSCLNPTRRSSSCPPRGTTVRLFSRQLPQKRPGAGPVALSHLCVEQIRNVLEIVTLFHPRFARSRLTSPTSVFFFVM